MTFFVVLFLRHNQPGMTNVGLIYCIGGVYVLLYAFASPDRARPGLARLGIVYVRLFYCLCSAALVVLFLNGTLWDYYQPLSLFDDVIAALAIAWLLLIAALVVAFIMGDAKMLPAALLALLGPTFLGVVHLITNPQPLATETGAGVEHQHLFVGGQGGYDIYRIPGLLVIPAGSKLADGNTLASDRTLVFAEARKNGALDTGVIDLVLRTSDDAGRHWSEPTVVCRHQSEQGSGKCGNPTPVFDRDTGLVWLAFNLSGIPENLPEKDRVHSAHVMASADGGTVWRPPVTVSVDDLVFGPGHGVQKRYSPAAGRLLLPAYRDGGALALASDDHGVSWFESVPLATGNESEIAELIDGSLYMATRHAAPIGRAPDPNGRLFARSFDGGQNWSETALAEQLPTPVCQATVIATADGTLLFANPAHSRTRVAVTLRASADGGESWPNALTIYPGPAGYSQLGQLSDGSVLLVYENGRMAYSERISAARIPVSLIPLPN